MGSWRQIRGFVRVEVVDTLRYWHSSMFYIALTAFYYLMLANFAAADQRRQTTVGFVILAVIAVTLYHFSSLTSFERIEPWYAFVRSLPTSMWVRFVARLLLVLLLAAFSSMVVVWSGAVRFGLTYDVTTILTVVAAVPICAAVFAPMGAFLGAALHPRTVPAVVTTWYLFNAWSGGLWSAGRRPNLWISVEHILPLPAVHELSIAIAAGRWHTALPAAAAAAAWGAGAFLLASVFYARDEGERFR